MSITIKQAEKELLNLLEKEQLCIFAGSGVSVNTPTLLPTWDGFIKKYKKICKNAISQLDKSEDFDRIINDVENYKKRDPIATITALRDIITICEKAGATMTVYNQEMMELFANRKCNSYHKTIVDTNYKYILTTNYDNLLGKAGKNNNHIELVKRCYNYKDINKISEAIYKKESAIINMHGTYPDIMLKEFVLTKEDYRKIKAENIGFRTLMNSIFMNYSILFIGYGSSDPHLEEIIDDINYNLKWNDSEFELDLPCYYLLILGEKLSPIFDHIKDKNRTKVIPVKKYGNMLTLLRKLQKNHPRTK